MQAESLAAIGGDRIFLLADAEEISNHHVIRLMDNPNWRALDSVKKGRYHIADSTWNFDDPLTRDRLLPVLPSILRRHSIRSDKCFGTA